MYLCFNRESDSVTVGAMGRCKCRVPQTKFQSRKRFRHCWSRVWRRVVAGHRQFQSRKRFRHCWSTTHSWRLKGHARGFNRESDSVTVGAAGGMWGKAATFLFQSRKRFRHCWSDALWSAACNETLVSIAKAIPSLLEPPTPVTVEEETKVSIAKAIPSLLEHGHDGRYVAKRMEFQSRKRFRHCWSSTHRLLPDCSPSFNRESDSVTVGAWT